MQTCDEPIVHSQIQPHLQTNLPFINKYQPKNFNQFEYL